MKKRDLGKLISLAAINEKTALENYVREKNERQQLVGRRQEMVGYLSEYQSSLTASDKTVMSIASLNRVRDFIAYIQLTISKQDEILRDYDETIQQRYQEYLVKKRERELIEKLEEKYRHRHLRELDRREQLLVEDITNGLRNR